jgi:hypothetical protein
MRVVEETWGSVYGNLINREEDGEVWWGMRGCEILGRYNSCDSFL